VRVAKSTDIFNTLGGGILIVQGGGGNLTFRGVS